MSHWTALNAGAAYAPKNGGTLATITAGAGQNGVQQTGPAIDRLGYDSGTIVMLSRSNLAATKTLTLACVLQDSADGSSWANVAAESQPGGQAGGGTLAVLSDTGDTQQMSQYDVNLRGLRRYMRVLYTATLSNTVTDTASVAVAVILGGSVNMPVT